MSDKPKPVDDLKEGLGLLFRAAKSAVDALPTNKLEDVAKDAAKEVGRAFESIGSEVEKLVSKATGTQPASPAAPPAKKDDETAAEKTAEDAAEKKEKDAPPFDDGYAPEPPKGPRVG